MASHYTQIVEQILNEWIAEVKAETGNDFVFPAYISSLKSLIEQGTVDDPNKIKELVEKIGKIP
jgi:hypothetical protein